MKDVLINLFITIPLACLLIFQLCRALFFVPAPLFPTAQYHAQHLFCTNACRNLKTQCQEFQSASLSMTCEYLCDSEADDDLNKARLKFRCADEAMDICAIQHCNLTCTTPTSL